MCLSSPEVRPDGVTVSVAVDTPDVRTLVIPAAPAELSDGELERFAIQAGACPETPVYEYCRPGSGPGDT